MSVKISLVIVLLVAFLAACATTDEGPAPVVTPISRTGTLLRVREIRGSQVTVEEFLSVSDVSFPVGSRLLLTKAGADLGAAEVRSVDAQTRRMVVDLLSQAIVATLSDLVTVGDILEGDLNDDEVLQTGASGTMDF